jgi:hypothetical protein
LLTQTRDPKALNSAPATTVYNLVEKDAVR